MQSEQEMFPIGSLEIGKLQVEGEVIHVVAARCFNMNFLLSRLTDVHSDELPALILSRADETTSPVPDQRGANKKEVFYKGRNFK